jgi:hypothetical protein
MIPKSCSKCGRPRDGQEPHGLCPACLLQQNAFTDTTDTLARERLCPGCEQPLAGDARFCGRCGTAAPALTQANDDPLRHALEEKLGGQYRLLRLLGRGGMGAVYLARDLTLEREVAIKVVTPAAERPGMYDRFRREAKTAARLSHPNIVPLHAFGEVDGMPYFVMGYVRGESLADRMRREGRLPEEESRRILAEVAEALDHAHRQGVVHRDVKPDNVLLEDASGRALLTDFGIARTMNQSEMLTQHGSVVGTPHYMSPEQSAGRADLDGRTDIYSLGVMGYAMLSGRLPFEGNSAADVLSKHLTQEPPSLRSLVPTISDSTLQAVERCLAKDPARRWQDSRAVSAALGATESSGLPDALEATRGQGLTFVAVGSVLLLLVWLVVVRLQHASPAIVGVVGGAITACYLAAVLTLRLDGFSIGLTQRVLWTEPGWWPYWYPRSLRRRGNVWDRLPAAVRRLRSLVVLAFVVFLITAGDPTENFTRKLAVFLIVVVIAAVSRLLLNRDLKRMGITSSIDRDRIAGTPASRVSFWSQPRISIVLAPAVEPPAAERADSPHDQLRAILRAADELSGPLRSLGAEAATAARRLVASIEEADRQIADLARNLEPGEEARLVEKIEALADVGQSGAMRELLEKQLELIRGLTARVEELKESRNRHIEMLKTLALHLASLRARLTETPSQVHSLTDSVRALCEHIGQQGAVVSAEDVPTMEQ